jgi:hypothetical protein
LRQRDYLPETLDGQDAAQIDEHAQEVQPQQARWLNPRCCTN